MSVDVEDVSQVAGVVLMGCLVVVLIAALAMLTPFLLGTGLWLLLPLWGVTFGFWKCVAIGAGVTLVVGCVKGWLS